MASVPNSPELKKDGRNKKRRRDSSGKKQFRESGCFCETDDAWLKEMADETDITVSQLLSDIVKFARNAGFAPNEEAEEVKR